MFLNKKWLFAAGALALTLAKVAGATDESSTLRLSPGANVCLLDDAVAINSVLAVGSVQPRPDGSRPAVRFRVRRSLNGSPGTFTTAAEQVTRDFSFVADAVTRSDLIPGHFRLCALNEQTTAVSVFLRLKTS